MNFLTTPLNKKHVFIFIIIIILVGLFGVWMFYGTLHPCGILEKDFRNIIDEEAKKGGQLTKLSYSLLGEPIINSIIAKLAPMECLIIKLSGEKEINLYLKEQFEQFRIY